MQIKTSARPRRWWLHNSSAMNIKEVNLEALDLQYEKLRIRQRHQEKKLLVSLGESGQQSPIVVVRSSEMGRYIVIDGHKRARILRKLKADVAKAVLWEALPPEALIRAYQIKSGGGYNALEEAWLIEEIHSAGWTLADCAKAMGKSTSWISRRRGLAESLPETVRDGVQKGTIAAYTAMKYLLPLARANIKDCETLAKKISEHALTSRQVEIIYRHYMQGPKAAAQKIMEDPLRFLRAQQETIKGVQDPLLNSLQNRCLNNLKITGNISLALARSLPEACGYDATEAARLRLRQAWQHALERLRLLEKTAEALFVQNSAQEPVVHA